MSERSVGGIPSPCKIMKKCRNIHRPPVGNLDQMKDTLIFQELELDHYIGAPYPGMPGAKNGLVPIMRTFGITKIGNSVCCHIHGFYPYFYINVPQSFIDTDCKAFKTKLNEAVVADIQGSNKESITDAVLALEIVKVKNLVGYTGEENQKFVKITVALPKFIPAVKQLIENQILYLPLSAHSFTFFESDVDIEMNFMKDTNIMGCCWLELPVGKWYQRNKYTKFPNQSRCQIEVDVSWEDFIAHSPEDPNWSDVARFRIHSFDIECAGRKDIFPVPSIDPVIQIANVVRLHGNGDGEIRNVFTLNTCAPIEHAEVRSFQEESEMLEEWAKFVRTIDPDVFTGYNIKNFDFRYLLERAKHLKLKEFDFLGRLLNTRLAVYCIKDADLPLRLLNHVRSFTNDVEMSRVACVPITSLLCKGEHDWWLNH